MVFNTLTLTVMIVAATAVMVAVAWGLLSTGLQEADDPTESNPEDLTDFEKSHTHRTDIRR